MTRSLLVLALLFLAACGGTETIQNPPSTCAVTCNPHVAYACGSRCIPYEDGCEVAPGELSSACDGTITPAGR